MKNILPVLICLLVACAEEEFVAPPAGGSSMVDLNASTSPLISVPTLKNIVEKGVIVGRMTCRVQVGAKIFAAMKDEHPVYFFTNGSPSGSVCTNIAYNETGMETINAGDDIKAWSEFESGCCSRVLLWEKTGE
jgi:hypothetical protein